MKAIMGKILRVNLTTKEFKEEIIPEEVYYNVLSGKGLGAWYLLKNIPQNADPLGPENILGFTTGLLTGTGALMCGRWTVCGKSPLTGGWGDSNCGGSFSPAIKQCGYDAIFFEGKSETPVYLYCDNKGPQLKDATPYWGLDATEAEEKLIKDNWVKKRPRVALIGQAGENLSYMAGICNDYGRIAARSGLGAVMGSKKLKAIVLCGSKPIPVADQEKIKDMSIKYGKLIKLMTMPKFVPGSIFSPLGYILAKANIMLGLNGALLGLLFRKWGTPSNTTMGITWGDAPMKNWSGSRKDFTRKQRESFNADKFIPMETKKYHCYACAMGCGAVLDVKKETNGRFPETHKPEYETFQAFGGLLLSDDINGILEINELMNRAGMDTISAGNTVAMAVECYENGIIKKEDLGFELNWGNGAGILKFAEMIINREGLGDVFADGCKVAAQKLGHGADKFAMHVGGSEPGMHDSRGDPLLGVHFVTEPAPGKHTIGMGLTYATANIHAICSWAPKEKLHNRKVEFTNIEEIAKKSVAMASYSMFTDGVGACLYGAMTGCKNLNLVKYSNAATGWDRTGEDYMECGIRIQTMRQMFNIKQGINPLDVKLPDRIAGKPALKEGPLKGKTLRNEETVPLHWKYFGWDEKTGVPLESTIEKLGINKLLEMEV